MRRVLLNLILFFVIGQKVNAQVSSYTFSAPSGTYTDITGGTEIFDLQDDDALTTSIPIGFNFVYNGVTYSQVQACSNGWLSFVTTQTNALFTNSLTNSNTIKPSLYPLWDDLDGTFEGLNFFITTGSAPNRVFTFEWRTFDWQLGAPDDVISFQVKLYETTNIIQFIYRQGAASPYSPSATIGIAGQTNGDYLTLNNSSASPAASSSTFTTDIAASPANGQIYQFAPPACSGTPAGGTTASTANPVCYNTSFTLSVTGASSGSGLTYQWQSSPDGTTWTDIGSATSSTYSTSIASSTWFRRAITCSGNTSYSSGLQVVVNRPSTTVTPASVCVNSSSVLTASASAGTTTLLSENFNGAAAGWTTTNNSTGGTPANAAWTLRPDGYVYTGFSSYTFHSNDNSQFFLSNSDHQGSGGSTNTTLVSPAFNTTGLTSCVLDFYHHFNYISSPDAAYAEVSTDGSNWATLQTYTSDQGTETAFVHSTISLNSYLGNAIVYIRFRFIANWGWWWAIDNVSITGTPSASSYSWTASPAAGAGLPAGAGTFSPSNNAVTVTPTIPGIFTYTVTSSNACLSPANVNVTAVAGGPGAGGLVSSNQCKTQTIITGDNYFTEAANCNIIAKVVAQGAAPVSGLVQACVTIDPTVQFYNGQPYVQRHTDIEPAINPSGSTARITLYATQAEFDAVNAADLLAGNNWPDLPTGPADAIGISRVRITQWHGTGTAPGNYSDPHAVLLSPVSVTWNATNSRWEIVLDVIGFSGFYIHTGYGFALSAPQITLTGRREGQANLLQWSVNSETTIAGYQVERSEDGNNYTPVGFIPSASPGGTNSGVCRYQFTDHHFPGDKQYYRIRQRAIDGRMNLSSVVILNGTTGDLLAIKSLFPNPATGNIRIMVSSPASLRLTLKIADITGYSHITREVRVNKGITSISGETERLAAGVYLLLLEREGGWPPLSIRFVKQ